MAVIFNILEAARSQLGTPWKHQGRTPFKSLDCLGLVTYAAYKAGVLGEKEWQAAHYRRTADDAATAEALSPHCFQVGRDGVEAGDLLWFKSHRQYSHFGIATGANTFIHSHSEGGRIVSETELNGYWKKQIHRVYRFRGEVE